jgi:hypothetical protein
MIMTRQQFAIVLLAGWTSSAVLHAAPGPATAKGVVPTEYPGNFVSQPDNNQVCYDMSALGYIGEVTQDMVGVKIDPPVPTADDYVSLTVSPDGRFLDWTAFRDARMLAIIVKGGNGYNLYDYTALSHTDDQFLHSPVFQRNGKWITPAISHYNLCYVDPPEPDNFNGCTPGYWRNHVDRWLGVSPSADYDSVFGVNLFSPDITLGAALKFPQTYGVFAFHSVAAYLNSQGGVPNAPDTSQFPGEKVVYPLTTEQVVAQVQTAVNTADDPDTPDNETRQAMDALKTALAGFNELGCPLEGTRAQPVP